MNRVEFRKLNTDLKDTHFDCGVVGINNMIKDSFYPTILQHLYCFEILIDGNTIGYYMIGFRQFSLDDCPEEIGDYKSTFSDWCYALHLKYIAISKKYQKNGIGTIILKTIIKSIQEMCKIWPIRLITLDAIDDKVEWYKQIGFKQFSETGSMEMKEIPMYMDLILEPQKVEEYISSMI